MSKVDKPYELYIDSFTFYVNVNVTDYHYQPALGPSADSDWDCYGYTEIDWNVLSILDYDEDGNETDIPVNLFCLEEYSELIEEKLLEIMKDEMDIQGHDDFDDGYDGY